jgi:hypothetical protein
VKREFLGVTALSDIANPPNHRKIMTDGESSQPRFGVFEINPPSERELIDQEEMIAKEIAEDHKVYEIPDLTMEDDKILRRLDHESFTLPELDERAKSGDDVVAELAAWAVCETAETAKDWGIKWPNTPCGREARRALEQARPKLFEIGGRKHQKRARGKKASQFFGQESSNPNIEPENPKGEEAKAGRAIAWWGGQELWCDHCGYGAKLEADDAKHRNWMHTGDFNVVRFRCLNCKAEMELSQRALSQLKKRAELGDVQAAAEVCGSIRMVIDWACNASNTTRGKVALAFLLGRFISEYFADSAWRPTTRRPCQHAPEWMAVLERSFADRLVPRRKRGGGATPLLLAEMEAVLSDYQHAKTRAEGMQPLWSQHVSLTIQVRCGLLSASDRAPIEICERGTPMEWLEGLLLPRLEAKYSNPASLKRDDPKLFDLLDRQMGKEGITLSAALRRACRRDWKTVAPRLWQTRCLGTVRESFKNRYRDAIAAEKKAEAAKNAKIAACKRNNKGHIWVIDLETRIPDYVIRRSHAENPKGECVCVKCGERVKYEDAKEKGMFLMDLERNAALACCDEKKIRAWAWKWKKWRLPEDPREFWTATAESIKTRPPRPPFPRSVSDKLEAKLAAELGEIATSVRKAA